MPPDKPRPLLPFAELLGIRVTRSESDLVEGELVVFSRVLDRRRRFVSRRRIGCGWH